MSSDTRGAFVWVWLAGQSEPVVAGRIEKSGQELIFNYGQSYLGREEAVSLYEPELPLKAGKLPLPPRVNMPSCIRDASPDAWGRRVIINQVTGQKRTEIDLVELDELAFLMNSGSDRIGALDFQQSATQYQARNKPVANLETLQQAAEMVEQGKPLPPELDQALDHRSSIGGARPKASIENEGRKFIAKFSGSSDTYSVVKAEFIAMSLAKLAGISVAEVQLTQSMGKDVLLVERFDRIFENATWYRKMVVSGLTILGLPEEEARYASYEDLAESIRHRFTEPKETLHELYRRMVFNILTGNTDDHARNHAAFWNGTQLTLTPAYDICPQNRTGGEASQAMNINGNSKLSQLGNCLAACGAFHLSHEAAESIVIAQTRIINDNYRAVCEKARLGDTERNFFWRRQFLNPYCFHDLEVGLKKTLPVSV